ncbi:MAG: hypothetical protein ABIP85_05440 [Chthoniobacteraceae bacterium]
MPPPAIRPGLITSTLRDAYDAVQEDLRQTKEAAIALEDQLADKSEEMVRLMGMFERTKEHLAHLQESIRLLREERHKLANEAMRAQGLELMLTRVTAERNRLKTELEGVIERLALEKGAKGLSFDNRDKRIAELTFQLINSQQDVEALRLRLSSPETAAPPAPAKSPGQDRIAITEEMDGFEIVPTERIGGFRR